MANGRTDEQDTPLVAKASQCRIRVWGLFGETHLGQRSCSRVEGRIHDRTRSVSQIKQNPLRSRGRPHMQQRHWDIRFQWPGECNLEAIRLQRVRSSSRTIIVTAQLRSPSSSTWSTVPSTSVPILSWTLAPCALGSSSQRLRQPSTWRRCACNRAKSAVLIVREWTAGALFMSFCCRSSRQ